MRDQNKTMLILLVVLLTRHVAFGFSTSAPFRLRDTSSRAFPRFLSSDQAEDALDELDQKRKDNLFQCLLRDLQIEGVPLLECDVSKADTLQAALWTTMAELSEQEDSQKVCLITEGIGVEALRTFANDFLALKTEQRLMDHLQELQRFNISVVGKGVGPAIVIETANKTQSTPPDAVYEEEKVNAAQKAFINRVVVGQEVCPFTASNSSIAPVGLESENVEPGQIGYRHCGFSEACHVLSSFWTCICELLSVDDAALSSVVLSMPAIGDDEQVDKVANHGRFSAVTELISRSLCLFRGDDVFETLYFYPGYDRSLVYPAEAQANGHLPPLDSIRPTLKAEGHDDSLSDQDLALSNYQRRAPFTGVVIKRAGQVQRASGAPCYARNVIKLVQIGEESLREALQAEIAMGQ